MGSGLRVLLWCALWLAIVDATLGFFFPPTSLQATGLRARLGAYLSYGLSTEARIRLYAGPPADDTATPGWLDPGLWRDQPQSKGSGQAALVSFFGNSFVRQVADAMTTLDPRLGARIVVAPAAPPSHSYAAYRLDKQNVLSEVVVLGLLADTLPGLLSMTRATQSVAQPNPYTYPRFRLIEGQFVEYSPTIWTLSELQSALRDPVLWRQHLAELAEHDDFYRHYLFESSWADKSVTVRLLRNAWAVRRQRTTWEGLLTADGLVEPDSEVAGVLRTLIMRFAQDATRSGQIPIVLAVSTPDSAGLLPPLLRTFLQDNQIASVFGGDSCAEGDARNFIGDGHFSSDCAGQIGLALSQKIHSAITRPGPNE